MQNAHLVNTIPLIDMHRYTIPSGFVLNFVRILLTFYLVQSLYVLCQVLFPRGGGGGGGSHIKWTGMLVGNFEFNP